MSEMRTPLPILLWEREMLKIDEKLKDHHVWYIISQNKIVLEPDDWCRELLMDDTYFYVGSYIGESMRDYSYAKHIPGLDL